MSWTLVIDIASWAFFLGGGFFLFVGSLGMLRLPDFWSRLHAASIIDSAGVGLILAGMLLQTGFTLISVKILIIIGFLLITGPTATHAVANAAFVSGSRPKDIVEDATATKLSKKTNNKKPKKNSRSKTVRKKAT